MENDRLGDSKLIASFFGTRAREGGRVEVMFQRKNHKQEQKNQGLIAHHSKIPYDKFPPRVLEYYNIVHLFVFCPLLPR